MMHISSVHLVTQWSLTLCNPMDCSTLGFPVYHQLPEIVKFMSIRLAMPSNHFILCHPHLLLSSIFPSIRVFCSKSVIRIGSQSTGDSALASVLPMNIQDWFHLGWTGWISLQSKGLSRVLSNTSDEKHQFFGTQLSL